MPTQMKADGVFEGGGVKGIGLVGAYEVVEKKGYVMQNVAGTSAGAIVAALIAAGYSAEGLKKIMWEAPYKAFKDEGIVDKIPVIGKALSVAFEKGIYEGNFFKTWLENLLEKAPRGPVRTFKDLVVDDPEFKDNPRYRYRLQVIAADITSGRLRILPGAIEEYGMKPDDLDVSWAVRMSMSIPFFFEPVKLKDSKGQNHFIVDGGVLSNFPVWIFDDNESPGGPAWPTFGFKLVEPSEGRPKKIRGPLDMAKALFSTMMEAHDALYIESSDFVRTIAIKTGDVRATDFDLAEDKVKELYESGMAGATKFFASEEAAWNFEAYKARHRSGKEKLNRYRELK